MRCRSKGAINLLPAHHHAPVKAHNLKSKKRRFLRKCPTPDTTLPTRFWSLGGHLQAAPPQGKPKVLERLSPFHASLFIDFGPHIAEEQLAAPGRKNLVLVLGPRLGGWPFLCLFVVVFVFPVYLCVSYLSIYMCAFDF